MIKGRDAHGLIFLLIVIISIGSLIRLYRILSTDFPLNDGGMFFVMTKELLESDFVLPKYTQYNFAGIPYAYPPLGFYLSALISKTTPLSLIDAFRYLPVFFSILTIPAFYFLSREILGANYLAIHATLFFAVLPPTFEWQIMGGGVTRSPAFLFSILALQQSIRAYKSQRFSPAILGGIFLGLTGSLHLEILWMTVIQVLISAWFFARNLKGIFQILLIGGVSFVIVSPYLAIVFSNHGLAPFLHAITAGEFSLLESLIRPLLFDISNEFFFTPILVFALIGVAYCIQVKEYYLPVLALAAILFDPRSMDRSLMLPVCMLASITTVNVFIPGVAAPETDIYSRSRRLAFFPSLTAAVLLVYILARSVTMTQTSHVVVVGLDTALSSSDRSAMQWVRETIPANSRFLILTTPGIWEANAAAEWFPALAQRTSMNTVQGNEWLPGTEFNKKQGLYDEVSDCIEEGLSCLEQLETEGLTYTHIYLSGDIEFQEYNFQLPFPIEEELRQSPHYSLLYENGEVKVFEKIQTVGCVRELNLKNWLADSYLP